VSLIPHHACLNCWIFKLESCEERTRRFTRSWESLEGCLIYVSQHHRKVVALDTDTTKARRGTGSQVDVVEWEIATYEGEDSWFFTCVCDNSSIHHLRLASSSLPWLCCIRAQSDDGTVMLWNVDEAPLKALPPYKSARTFLAVPQFKDLATETRVM
jgi:hypothetical protein